MRLRRLDIQQLPGIRSGFELKDLDPGINLVIGPNASGKSSLVRALRYLLRGPASADPSALSLEADFQSGDHSLRVSRTGRQVSWRRDGEAADPPPLPDSRFFHCYWLTVEDLLQVESGGEDAGEEERDERIAERLRRELTGGYDVEALLRRDGPFQVGARHGGRESKEFRDQRKKVLEVERAYTELQQERERIPELRRRIEDGSGNHVRINRIERALELLEARRARLAAEAALAEFPAEPEEMERLRGGEGDRLDGLATLRQGKQQEQAGWREQRRQAEEALDDTGLGERIPDPDRIEEKQRLLQQAREKVATRGASIEKRDTARAAEGAAARDLGAPEGTLPALDPETISTAERIADRWIACRAEAHELEARLRDLPGPEEPAELERHREGAGALRDWLRAGPTDLRQIVPAAIAALAGSLAAIAAVLTGSTALGIAAVVLAVSGMLALVLMVWTVRQQRAAAERRFAELGMEGPAEWDVTAVRTRLKEIESALGGLQERQARRAAAERDRQRLTEVEEEQKGLETEKEELARRIGFDPERTATSLDRFIRLVDRVDAARREIRSADGAIERIEEEIAGRAGDVRAFLAEWATEGAQGRDLPDLERLFSGPPEIPLEALDTALRRLSSKAEQVREAGRTIAEADRNLSRIGRELEQITADEEGIFRGAGLAAGERRTLDTRLEALEAFREGSRRAQETRIAETQARSALADEKELLTLVESGGEEGLRARLERFRTDEEQRESEKEEVTRLQTLIDTTGTDHRLEAALAGQEEARSALEDAREEALHAAAGRFLLDAVKEEHRIGHEPAVLQDARERFARFTRNGWILELDEVSGFAACDREQGERRRLSELSSATRMQLLLAMRMAWTRTLEEGREPLPFFLDEALTTSDPERFHEVASSVASLVRDEDRQVFYLCAQPTDVQLWARTLGRVPRVIDLGALRFGQPSEASPEDFVLPEREQIPEPAGRSPEEYAVEIGVNPIDPWEDPGGIHIFHLLRDDLDLLHTLLDQWGISALGPLAGLLAAPTGVLAVSDEAQRRRLGERCRAARVWVEAWREGRGRPVDRGVLEECEVVTGRFIEEVAALAAEAGGDPEALLERLSAISGWGSRKTTRLREWLEERGYLDSRTALDAPEREARVLGTIRDGADPGDVRETVRWLEAGLKAAQADG